MPMQIALILIAVGMLLMLAGMLLVMLSLILGSKPRASVEFGGGVLVGPIPIVFGSTSRSILIAAILMLVVMVIALILILAIPHIVRYW